MAAAHTGEGGGARQGTRRSKVRAAGSTIVFFFLARRYLENRFPPKTGKTSRQPNAKQSLCYCMLACREASFDASCWRSFENSKKTPSANTMTLCSILPPPSEENDQDALLIAGTVLVPSLTHDTFPISAYSSRCAL